MKPLTSYKINTRLLSMVNMFINEHSKKNEGKSSLRHLGMFSAVSVALLEAERVKSFLASNPEQSEMLQFVFNEKWNCTSILKQTIIDAICRSYLPMESMKRLNERLEEFNKFNLYPDHNCYLTTRNRFIIDEICIINHHIDILDKINSI